MVSSSLPWRRASVLHGKASGHGSTGVLGFVCFIWSSLLSARCAFSSDSTVFVYLVILGVTIILSLWDGLDGFWNGLLFK